MSGLQNLDVSGGFSTNLGHPGRVILGHNLVTAPVVGSISNGTNAELSGGPRESNPYLWSATDTAFIADLLGGSEIYGLTGLTPADFPDVVDGAPPGAIGAIVRMEVGPAGFSDDYKDLDMVLLVNLDDQPIADPSFGAGAPGSFAPLMVRGFANRPDFGGSGPVTLDELEPGHVWTTLVNYNELLFNMGANGESVFAKLLPGDAANLVPGVLPCPWDLDGDRSVGTSDLLDLLAAWGSDPGGPPDFDGDGNVGTSDLLDLLASWGDCP